MTEAVDMVDSREVLPKDLSNLEVVTVARFEGLPLEGATHLEMVDADSVETVATTKEEEWVTKKKTELTTTRQIETRVKRQVVLEDGKVVEDSGPIVTTNTTEDTEKQEHEQTEHRTLGEGDGDADDGVDAVDGGDRANELTASIAGDASRGTGGVAVKKTPPSDGVVKEVKERRVISREETEETREIEDVKHLGDITDEQYLAAVQSGHEDLRIPLEELDKNRTALISTGPRLVNQSIKTKKTVDTEDTEATSAIQSDGRLVTETKRITEHEETKDEELPDENAPDVDVVNETSQKHIKTKDQEIVDYVADGVTIGREMRYNAETMEGERFGDGVDDPQDWDSLSTRIRKTRRQNAAKTHVPKHKVMEIASGVSPLDRKDALTKKPIDFDQEEETRKEETSKWLEHHFGSDSRSSGSLDADDTGPSTSYFNVTIKSKTHKVESPVPAEPSTSKSFIATTNHSPKNITPTVETNTSMNNKKFFQGVSEWNDRSRSTQSPKEQVNFSQEVISKSRQYGSYDQLNRSGSPRFRTQERSSPKVKTVFDDDSDRMSPFVPIQVEEKSMQSNTRTTKRNEVERDMYEDRNYGKNYHERDPAYHNREANYGVPTPPVRKRASERKQRASDDSRYDSGYRSHSRNEMSYRSRDSKEDIRDIPFEEPPPDYSPPPRETPSPSPSPPLAPTPKEKKHYQRTRFAADIPSSKQPTHTANRQSTGSKIGQGIRKLVGKIRSASAERKAKLKAKRLSSRSPSPHHSRNSPTYHQFNVIDNIPPPADTNTRVGRHHEVGVSSDNKQVPSTLSRSRVSDQNMAETRSHRTRPASPVQRYYLGEDPFGGSIYGRENKYDGVKPARSTKKQYYNNGDGRTMTNGYHHRGSNHSEDEVTRTQSNTLGRFSKSTSRLIMNDDSIDYSRNVQTLPRKIHHHHETTRHYNNYDTENRLSHSPPTRLRKDNKSSSTINVSIINTVSPPSSTISINRPLANGGPAKPARTYKSSLARSKSFNVHAGDVEPPSSFTHSSFTSNVYKSNPHLHRINENPIGLKSPGIVSNISRSQRDINDAIIEEDRKESTLYTSRFIKNGHDNDKKKLFMKGLADRAPELFKTLHGNDEEVKKNYAQKYTSTPMKNGTGYRSTSKIENSFSTINDSTGSTGYTSPTRLNNYSPNSYASPISKVESNFTTPVKHTVIRRGSNSSDNYSETYHITSKSDDPKRPSITNTVQSFSKKTVPSKDGRSRETIESRETKTVTKSRYLGEPLSNVKYNENGGKVTTNGGVVIEVRNNYRK